MRKNIFLVVLLFCNYLANSQEAKLKEMNELLPVIHWDSQSPVKNQGVKYTCTAFAIAAAIETFPNVPKDLSEKYLYALQKGYEYANKNKTIVGHELNSYPESLMKDGAIEERYLPYSLDYEKAKKMTQSQFEDYMREGEIGFITLMMKYKKKATVFVKDYEYLNVSKIKNIEYIKQQLRNGVKAIPVSYTPLYMPAWSANPSLNFNTITPDAGFKVKTIGGYVTYSEAKKLYGKDLNKKINNQEVSMELKYPRENYGGHAVAIIGYDSKGFIIKNSYGSGWRVRGYERVSFDYHEIFAREGLIIKNVMLKNK